MKEQKLFDTVPGGLYDPGEIVAIATAEHTPLKTFVLCSGGNDSMVLLHFAMSQGWPFDAVVHVNTGTGVCEGGRFLTTDFVHNVCDQWSVPLIELRPPKSYEELFLSKNPIISGMPGPGMHHIAYNRLKERPLNAFVKTQKTHWRDRIMWLTGIREDESAIRMGYQESIIDRRGAQVWVNPIYRWTNEQMREYRKEHDLPQNPVAEHIHISGECLCGCFARPGEREEIRFFFPDTAARIDSWEAQAQANGLNYCQWGLRRKDEDSGKDLLMCRQCVGQMEFDIDATTQVDALLKIGETRWSEIQPSQDPDDVCPECGDYDCDYHMEDRLGQTDFEGGMVE